MSSFDSMVSGVAQLSGVAQQQITGTLAPVARKQLHATLDELKVQGILKAEAVCSPPALPAALAKECTNLLLDKRVNVAIQAVLNAGSLDLEKAWADASNDGMQPLDCDRLRHALVVHRDHSLSVLLFHEVIKELLRELG